MVNGYGLIVLISLCKASILNFSEGELRKIGMFLRYPESIDMQNGLQQSGAIVLFVEVILALTATILGVINLIRWNTDLPLISFLITILAGVVFTLRGVESRLNKEKGYKITIGFGLIICIIAIITFIIKYFRF